MRTLRSLVAAAVPVGTAVRAFSLLFACHWWPAGLVIYVAGLAAGMVLHVREINP